MYSLTVKINEPLDLRIYLIMYTDYKHSYKLCTKYSSYVKLYCDKYLHLWSDSLVWQTGALMKQVLLLSLIEWCWDNIHLNIGSRVKGRDGAYFRNEQGIVKDIIYAQKSLYLDIYFLCTDFDQARNETVEPLKSLRSIFLIQLLYKRYSYV